MSNNKSPIQQGSLQQISDLFIRPFISYCPPMESMRAFIERVIFHDDDSFIFHYISEAAFKLPGKFWLTSTKFVEGIGFRDIKPGTELFARVDTTMPNRVDVEVLAGVGRKDQVFLLEAHEWASIKHHLKIRDWTPKEVFFP